MVRATQRLRNALRNIRTAEVDVSYHCRVCKGHYTGSLATTELDSVRCHCGSADLLLLSAAPEPASPLLRMPGGGFKGA
jgi:hypothetical protein